MATSNAMNTSNQYVKYKITVTQNPQNVANNTSNVTVSVRFYRTNTGYETWGTGTVYCKIDGTTYSAAVTPDQKITSSGIVLFSKTLNIKHGTDGTKKLTCSAWISHDVLTSSEQSYTQTLTTIPRKSSLTASNGTLGTEQTLTVTRQADSFTHTIAYKCGNTSGTICSKSKETSIKWTPPLSLANQNTTGTSVSVVFTITTYNGSTSIGSNTKTITCTIPSGVKPACTLEVTDAAGYADTYGGYIKGLSKLKVEITATAAYGSAIASYKTTANGATYTAASFTTDVLKTAGTLNISTTVTDKRGRSGSASETLTVLDYAAPVVSNLSVLRCDEDGTENDQGEFIKIRFSGSVTGLNSKNTAVYQLQYKKTSDTAYTTTEITALQNMYSVVGEEYVFAADSGSSYDVALLITDNFSTSVKSTSASTAFTLMHWAISGRGMAIGKVSEQDDLFDVGLKTKHHRNVVLGNDMCILGIDTDGIEQTAFVPVTSAGDTAVGYGFYNAKKGNTHIYGHKVQFYTNEGIYTNGNKVVMNNGLAIYGIKPDGSELSAFTACNKSGHTHIGYGGYAEKSGLTAIMGYDVNFDISNLASPLTYRPYRRRGDKLTLTLKTGGYVTNAGTEVYFYIPFTVPIIGSPVVSIASGDGFILRQGGKYTHGSAETTYVKPSKYVSALFTYHGIQVRAVFSDKTNAINNDTIGVHWNGTITLS